MYDELTKEDIQKMQEELDYRTRVLRPQLIDDVKVARGFGDLSENFEYKAAKRNRARHNPGHHAPSERARRAHKQGEPRGQGRNGPPRRGTGLYQTRRG